MNVKELTELLDEAVVRGQAIGVDVESAAETLENARNRVGLTEDTFVVALVGGTGVGKSSILNALAGADVARASVLRPTTETPTAWVPESSLQDVNPLLEWLGVETVVMRPDGDLPHVAIVDLPDIDSVASDHRALVDRLLPRIDVVVWVVDPEKYDDERLHIYLRKASEGGGSTEVILNKTDQLAGDEVEAVVRDLRRRLGDSGFNEAVIRPMSASSGVGVADFRASLERGAGAKQAILAKIGSDVRARMTELAAAAGVADPDIAQMHADDALAGFAAEATEAALEIVDPEGVALQLKNMYLEQARIGAGSLLSRLGTLIRYLGGHRRRHADPKGFLLNWRGRGDIGRAVNPIRAAYMDLTRPLGSEARATVMSRFDPDAVRRSLAGAIDRSVRSAARQLETAPIWPMWVLAPLQWIATIGFVFAVAWYLLIIFGPGGLPVETFDLPILGAVPTPLALLVVSALLSFLVGGLARLLASFSSRKRGRRLAGALRSEMSAALDADAFLPLRTIEENRNGLADLFSKLQRS
jgi:GTP-binding protein EngB required for normal cell division